MPAWFSALSPETLLVAIAGVGGVLALLLAIAAVRLMRGWQFRKGSVYLVFAAVVAAVGVLGGMLAASLHTYSRLTHEEEAARAVLRELGPQRYEMLLVRTGGPAQRFELRGDEWQIDARVMKWGRCPRSGTPTRQCRTPRPLPTATDSLALRRSSR
jgi:NhaP-type Na+/H+ or K+/H+ antiporter